MHLRIPMLTRFAQLVRATSFSVLSPIRLAELDCPPTADFILFAMDHISVPVQEHLQILLTDLVTEKLTEVERKTAGKKQSDIPTTLRAPQPTHSLFTTSIMKSRNAATLRASGRVDE